jgi:hypothetical protein
MKNDLQWTVFRWMKNYCTVDTIWMNEKRLYSGRYLDEWKTIVRWTVFGWMKNDCTVDSLWMNKKLLYSGQSLDEWKTIVPLTVFGWIRNYFTVDSLWMNEKRFTVDSLWMNEKRFTVDSLWMNKSRLYSGQSLDEWKIIVQWTVLEWVKIVFHSKGEHSTDETDSETEVFCYCLLLVLGVWRHVQTTQHKISTRTPSYYSAISQVP